MRYGTKSFDERLGSRMRMEREKVEMPLVELAERLNITYQMLQKYEKGTCRVPVELLVDWCSFFAFPIASILKEVRR